MDDIKAIFFDFDETLVNTYAATEAAYEDILETLTSQNAPNKETLKSLVQPKLAIEVYKEGLRSTPNSLYKTRSPRDIRTELWGNAVLQSLPEEKKHSFSEADAFNLAAELYEIWNKMRLKNLKMLESTTEEVLCSLRKEYNLVLITNGSSVVQWEKIKAINIERLFDHVIVSGDEKYDKPHVSIFQKACFLCNLQPRQCVMVGDTLETDILGANKSDFACSVLYKPNGKEMSESVVNCMENMRPTHTVTSIAQLPSIIASL